jgi:glycosyltransferase involved in cell wall biosynthesis
VCAKSYIGGMLPTFWKMTLITRDSMASELEKTPKVSVILTVKNEERTIGHAIESVLRLNYPNYEVMVVDGGSKDQTVDVAKNHGVRIVQTKDSTPGQGRNVGIVNSSHPIVAFVDGDCYIERKDWLRNSVDLLIQEKDIGGVGGPVTPFSKASYMSKAFMNVLSAFFVNAGSAQFARYEKQREVKSISSCNAVYRREAIDRAGLFAEDLRFCEDADLNYKIKKLGYRLVYSPKMTVEHDWKVYSFSSLFRYMFRYGVGRAVAVKKHPYLFSLLNAVPSIALVCISFLFLLSLVFGGIFMYATLLLVSSYCALSFISAFFAAHRFKDIKMVLVAPVTYVLVHVGYAIGFISGLFGRNAK